MGKEKVTSNDIFSITTGYYDENNKFILHSYEDEPSVISVFGFKSWHKDGLCHRDNEEPACLYESGTKYWYDNGIQYLVIENQRYNIDDVYEKFKDKIIKVGDDISQNLTDMNIDFISVDYYDRCDYLILDDTDRNEVILKYG